MNRTGKRFVTVKNVTIRAYKLQEDVLHVFLHTTGFFIGAVFAEVR